MHEQAEQIRLYLTSLTRDMPADQYFYIWTLSKQWPGIPKRSYARWYQPSQLEQAIYDSISFAASGDNVFCGQSFGPKGTSRTRLTNETSLTIPGVRLDLDFGTAGHEKDGLPANEDEALEMIQPILDAFMPTMIVSSGGGLHLYWLFHSPYLMRTQAERDFCAELLQRWNNMGAKMARDHGCSFDSLADFARILRVPGTTNYKPDYGDQGHDCTLIIHDDAIRYNPLDLWTFCEPFETKIGVLGRRTVQASERAAVGDLEIDLDATIDHDKWEALYENEARFKRLWNHKDKRIDSQPDHSASVYEWNLITMLVSFEWHDQAIVDAIMCWRRKHHLDSDRTIHYFQFTIGKARAAIALDTGTPPPPPTPPTDNAQEDGFADGGELTHDQRLEQLSGLFGFTIQRIVRWNVKTPQYQIITLEHGAISVGGVANLIDWKPLRTKLAECSIPLRRFSGRAWDNTIYPLILSVIETEEIEEATTNGVIADLVRGYLAKSQIMPDAQTADENDFPLWHEGELLITLAHLKDWIAKNATADRLNTDDITVGLRQIGAKNGKQIAVHSETAKNNRTTKRYWQIPAHLAPQGGIRDVA